MATFMKISNPAMSIRSRIRRFFRQGKHQDAAPAYDRWSANYDHQPGNLMLDLDAQVFKQMMEGIDRRGSFIVDIGCGTGRHWPWLMEAQPARLLGFDISAGMIAQLKAKYPGAEAQISSGHPLYGLGNGEVDLLISTLTIAHIKVPGLYFEEWARVLKPGGQLVLTDYHPAALAKGAERNFRDEGGDLISIRNFIHPLESLIAMLEKAGFEEIKRQERVIDERVKYYYDEQSASQLYHKFYGTPIIYGMRLEKRHAHS
jgi:SAM-dependent methyltransferase